MAQDGRAPCAERYAGLGVRRTLHRFPRLPHPAARALPHAAAAGVVPADVCGVPARTGNVNYSVRDQNILHFTYSVIYS